jgi:alanyl-tRNA synthetase
LKKKQQQEKNAAIDLDRMISAGSRVNDVPTVIEFIDALDRKQLSALADEVKHKTGGIAVFLTNTDGKSAVVVSIAEALTGKLNAGKIVKDIAGKLEGSGGGRPDFAQAGGIPVQNFLKFKPQIIDIIGRYLR